MNRVRRCAGGVPHGEGADGAGGHKVREGAAGPERNEGGTVAPVTGDFRTHRYEEIPRRGEGWRLKGGEGGRAYAVAARTTRVLRVAGSFMARGFLMPCMGNGWSG